MVAGSAIVRLIGPFLALPTLTVGDEADGEAAEVAGSAWRQAAEKTRAPPNSEAAVWALAAAFMIGSAPRDSCLLRAALTRLLGFEGARACGPARLQDGEHGGKDGEGREGGDGQPADDGPAEGSRLLAPLSEADRHGDHAGDHRGARHQDGPQPVAGCLHAGRGRWLSRLARPLGKGDQ